MAGKKLATYNAKRDFKKTAEPSGKVSKTSSGFSYLIQKHAATRLHYDFRLELDGVLKSWAVTRGPSLDPQDKRLAVEVEDHPVDYGSFEGVIPQGEYGGGTVMLWDEGTWEPLGNPAKDIQNGSLKFKLHGKRLKGEWALVRMKDRENDRHHNWLLLKHHDKFAVAGAGESHLAKHATSIVSKRSMEKIAEEADRVWKSNRTNSSSESPSSLTQKKVSSKRAKVIRKKSATVKLPEFIAPQLATLTDAMPKGKEWLHEIKFDGYRVQVHVENAQVRMLTRNGLDWTEKFGGLSKAFLKIAVENAIFDGELVALDKENISSFAQLKNILSESGAGLSFYAFDLLHLNGESLLKRPLVERKARLKPLIMKKHAPIFYSEHFKNDGDFMQRACSLRLEGVISKLGDAPYHSGRGKTWLKTKCHKRQEFVIGGFTLPSNGGVGIGSMLLGYYEGKVFVHAGRVGTGFDHATAQFLRKKLCAIKIKEMPFGKYSEEGRRGKGWKKDVIWVKPELVCEVEFTEWTQDGSLRHPSFQGLREDKPARTIRRDVEIPVGKATKEAKQELPADKTPKALKQKVPLSKLAKVAQHEPPAQQTKTAKPAKKNADDNVTLTHPDKVIWPDKGYTKQDLADYYASVAEWILPYIKDRPLSLVRCPAGSGKACFFQRHTGTGSSSHLVELPIYKDEEPYLMIRDAQGLQAMVQMGVLEIHNWGSHAATWDKPDMMVFDLDPDPSVSFAEVKNAALEVRRNLRTLKLESFVRVTGGKGLHVVVPIKPQHGWDAVKQFARSFAEIMAEHSPEKYTTNIRKAERKGKIFIDYLRNGETATAIASYSSRARDTAPVCVPIGWEELAKLKAGNVWTIKTLPARLKKLRIDPWKAFFTTKQSLKL